MEDLIKKIDSHIAFDDDLEKKDVLDIITQKEDLRYKGKVYRVLLFSNETDPKTISLEEDCSFSSSLKGIRNYMMVQDLDYYQYCIIYEATILGLDIIKAVYSIPELKSKREIADREFEIVLGELYESSVYLSGKSEEIYNQL